MRTALATPGAFDPPWGRCSNMRVCFVGARLKASSCAVLPPLDLSATDGSVSTFDASGNSPVEGKKMVSGENLRTRITLTATYHMVHIEGVACVLNSPTSRRSQLSMRVLYSSFMNSRASST